MEKEVIRVKFVDFWEDLNKTEGNVFYDILSPAYHMEFSKNPDILFYSSYGNEYLKYKCKRIFYTGENQRPDFRYCDYAVSFDFLDHPRHFRFPLFGLYCKPENLIANNNNRITLSEWRLKNKFCCILVSNPNAKERLEFFHKLSKYKQVDSAGKWNTNIEGGPWRGDKKDFIKDYKFVISFENSSYPGYTTEKVIEPIMVNSIPIYWGNSLVHLDINEERIINVNRFESMDSAIEKIIEMDKDDLLALAMVNQPAFNENVIPPQINRNDLLNFFTEAINSKRIPVAKTMAGMVYDLKRILLLNGKSIKQRMGNTLKV